MKYIYFIKYYSIFSQRNNIQSFILEKFFYSFWIFYSIFLFLNWFIASFVFIPNTIFFFWQRKNFFISNGILNKFSYAFFCCITYSFFILINCICTDNFLYFWNRFSSKMFNGLFYLSFPFLILNHCMIFSDIII